MLVPEFYKGYIKYCQYDSIVKGLMLEGDASLDFYKSLGPALYEHRYAQGKWSIREILGHVIDGERVFAYRAMCMARGDKTPLPGFEQDDYIPNMNLGQRPMNSLITEFATLRASSVDLFTGFSAQMLGNTGTASGYEFDVESLGKIIVGHEIHHRKVIEEKYMNS